MKLLSRLAGAAMLAGSLLTAIAADAPKDFKVSEFNFSTPAGWTKVETTSVMRKAQLKFGEGKDAAEVIFFHFGPGGGGGAKANVDRWLSQFKETREELKSKTEEVTVKNRKITYVEADGTYLSGLPGGPKTEQPGTTLLGAIVPSEDGDVFIRCTGPTASVGKQKDAFRKMVESAIK